MKFTASQLMEISLPDNERTPYTTADRFIILAQKLNELVDAAPTVYERFDEGDWTEDQKDSVNNRKAKLIFIEKIEQKPCGHELDKCWCPRCVGDRGPSCYGDGRPRCKHCNAELEIAVRAK